MIAPRGHRAHQGKRRGSIGDRDPFAATKPKSFVTNLDNDELDVYLKTIAWYNKEHGDVFSINRSATARDGIHLKGSSALHCTDRKGLQVFWEKFEELQQQE